MRRGKWGVKTRDLGNKDETYFDYMLYNRVRSERREIWKEIITRIIN